MMSATAKPEDVLSQIARARRAYIRSSIKKIGNILELGAFDNPTFRRELGDDVRYLDWFSRDELIEMHGNNPRRNPGRVVDVDYVVRDHSFAPHIDLRFSLISACHVIEHVADVIFWLNQLEDLLADDGRIFLAIPDRRYTFDYYRQVSESVSMVRAHEAQLTRPDKWQLAEHFYYHQKVDLTELWAGNKPPDFKPRFSLAKALRMAEKKASAYTDAHCWVFTPPSFRRALNDLRQSGYTDLTIAHLEGTRHGTSEFWVVLESGKRSGGPQREIEQV